MKTIIQGGTVVNEGRSVRGDIVIEEDRITAVCETAETPRGVYDQTVDASGCFVFPGVIDAHVHFREPGLTRKADIESESRAAAFGGVTSYMEMPNTSPQTTTPEAWQEKMAIASRKSHVNYSFFYGATNSNTDTFASLDRTLFPGIKLFMGASTGNMLVDKRDRLEYIYKVCADLDLQLMTHCEDTDIITSNMLRAKSLQADPDISLHPLIRSEEACYRSTALAVELARKYGTRLHVAHLTTARELSFFGLDDRITAEVVLAHLLFSDEDYQALGTRIKCNPAVKTKADRNTLRRTLTDGRITTVGTDHAPHELKDKEGGCLAASGMPMVQFSLVAMLELADQGILSRERVVELMCHNPARLFRIDDRGFLRKGYKADLTIVRPASPWTVTTDTIESKCKWSPLEGRLFNNRVQTTICNGHVVYDRGLFDASYRGEPLTFHTS